MAWPAHAWSAVGRRRSSLLSPLSCAQARAWSSGSKNGDGAEAATDASTLADWASTTTSALPTTTSPPSAAALLPDASAPVAAVADALQGLHTTTGLPWWATLPVAALGVRAALAPLTLASARAAAAAGPLLAEARKVAAAEAQEEGAARPADVASQQPPPPPPASPRAVLAAFSRLRAAAGAPHPAWVAAAPLAQLPVLAAAVLGVRAMATGDWPGLADGGALWFPDLTARAVEAGTSQVAAVGAGVPPGVVNPATAALVAPLGPAGAVLPAAVGGTMLASAAVGLGRSAAAGSGLARTLRLVVEWAALPAFLAALALPQGAVLYWAGSSAASLAQSLALQSGVGRGLVMRGVGLPASQAAAKVRAAAEAAGPASPDLPPTATLDATAAGPAGPHLVAAATAKAGGDGPGALKAALAATAAAPDDPRAWFALGQLRAAEREWAGAGDALARAAAQLARPGTPAAPGLEDPALRTALAARASMAGGIAQAMQGELGAAVASFAAAAAAAEAGGGGAAALVAAAAAARKAGRPLPPAAALAARAHLARAAALAEDGQVEEALAAAKAGAAIEPAAEATHVRALREKVEAARGGGGCAE